MLQWPEAGKYVSPISVFDPPSLFAKILSETVPIEPGKTRLLDIGCGTGIVGIYCLIESKAEFVTFNDIQDAAILETHSNVATHIQRGAINERSVAGIKCPFNEISPDIVARHDLIVFNPPQLPTNFVNEDYLKKTQDDDSMSRFRLGGPNGLAIAEKFFDWFAALNDPKPDAVIMLSSFLGEAEIKMAIEKRRLECDILKATPVPLRAIFNHQANILFNDEKQRANRMLEKDPISDPPGGFVKKLLTIRIPGSGIKTPPNHASSTAADPPMQTAVVGFNEAVEKFQGNLAGLAQSSFAQQYLKGALDNMETGRLAVQEKVKFAIPTVFGTLVASAAIASFALRVCLKKKTWVFSGA